MCACASSDEAPIKQTMRKGRDCAHCVETARPAAPDEAGAHRSERTASRTCLTMQLSIYFSLSHQLVVKDLGAVVVLCNSPTAKSCLAANQQLLARESNAGLNWFEVIESLFFLKQFLVPFKQTKIKTDLSLQGITCLLCKHGLAAIQLVS